MSSHSELEDHLRFLFACFKQGDFFDKMLEPGHCRPQNRLSEQLLAEPHFKQELVLTSFIFLNG